MITKDTKNDVIGRNAESKFEISKYDTQKERDDFLLKLLCENRERRKSIVSENAKARDIENKSLTGMDFFQKTPKKFV